MAPTAEERLTWLRESVIAAEPVRTLALASWDLFAVLDVDPHLARNLLVEFAARIRAADARID